MRRIAQRLAGNEIQVGQQVDAAIAMREAREHVLVAGDAPRRQRLRALRKAKAWAATELDVRLFPMHEQRRATRLGERRLQRQAPVEITQAKRAGAVVP
jgi:hypothetical protein